MKLADAAFQNLVVLARIDGKISSQESVLLDRYREALGVPESKAEALLSREGLKPVDPSDLEGSVSERKHLLQMMIRVACADGRLLRSEKKLLMKLARSLSIGRVAFADLVVEINGQLGTRRRLKKSQIVAVLIVCGAAAILYFLFRDAGTRTDRQVGETRMNIEALRQELGQEWKQAEEALERVRKTQDDLAREEAALTDRLKEVEDQAASIDALKASLTDTQEQQRVDLEGELSKLRGALARVRKRNTVFQETEKEYGASILLIFTKYDLVSGSDRVTEAAMGTGFFVSTMGHIVTNKHVAQPWKFSDDDVMLIQLGYTVDPATVLYTAWPAGTVFKDEKGNLVFDSAYSTMKNTLSLEKTTSDTFAERTGRLATGTPFKGSFHTLDNGDLALLKADVKSPVRALPLALGPEGVDKLDPVMVLGFPFGVNILETRVAETSPSLGEVRKVQTSIMVTAPIVPGNSGGPLIDLRAEVVGVAAKTFGDSSLGSCIPIAFAVPLLPEAEPLLQEAERLEAAGRLRDALDTLQLAELRSADDDTKKMILDGRARLFEDRNARIEKAKALRLPEERRQALLDVIDRFGRRWCGEAADLLEGL